MNSVKRISISIWSLIALVLYVFVFNKCATIGHPTGGDKDTVPPEIVYINPPFKTVNFDANKVEAEFNEYVQVKDLNKELVVSPPIEKNPEIRIKGKGFFFNIDKEELIDSATYIFSFGNAIKDINEGNILDLSYVFSTGPIIDSFSLSGKIVNAFNLQPSKEPFWIMLYENLADSAPYKEKPLYTGRSNAEGIYEINYIKPGTYRLFALKDINFNFKYDKIGEIIAFSDTLITLSPELFINIKDTVGIADTIANTDSTNIANDSVLYENAYGLHYNLYSFLEKSADTLQYLKTKDYLDNRLLVFSFNVPVTDSFGLNLIKYPEISDWYLPEYSYEKDSINLWITDTFLLSLDTIDVTINYLKHDSALNLYIHTDTISFRKRANLNQKNKRKSRDEEQVVNSNALELSILPSKNKYDLTDKIEILSTTPLLRFDTTHIRFYELIDTIQKPLHFDIFKDSLSVNKYQLDCTFKENSIYKLFIFDSAFTDIYNHSNDTLKPLIIQTKTIDSYGILYLTVSGIKNQVLLQLLNEKEKLVEERIISNDKQLKFEYLNPGKYILKVIYDTNTNGKWDTGNYLKNILPEKVKYYPGELNIRQNWEHSENWDISK